MQRLRAKATARCRRLSTGTAFEEADAAGQVRRTESDLVPATSGNGEQRRARREEFVRVHEEQPRAIDRHMIDRPVLLPGVAFPWMEDDRGTCFAGNLHGSVRAATVHHEYRSKRQCRLDAYKFHVGAGAE